jgi:hypothetical protein
MSGSRRKEALIGGGVSLVFVLLAIVVVLHQSPDQSPTLISNAPLGSVAPQVLGTVYSAPPTAPDPSVLQPPTPAIETKLVTSTITALSTVLISGKPVVQTAFSTATETQRVTLTPKPAANKTILTTRTFLATITQAGQTFVAIQTATQTTTETATTTATQFNTTTQTATKTQNQTQTQTQTQTATVTATKTVTATETDTATQTVAGPTTTQTVTATQTVPGPTTVIISPGPTVTVTTTAQPGCVPGETC